MQVMVASIYREEQSTVPIYVKYVFVPPTRLYMLFKAHGREEIRKVFASFKLSWRKVVSMHKLPSRFRQKYNTIPYRGCARSDAW